MLKCMTSAAMVAALSFASAASAETRLQGAGATFPNPIYQVWVTEYQKAHPDVKIDYQSIGSGGGIKAITEKTVDFAGSDAPMSAKEMEAAKDPIIHIPTVAGVVVPAYNLPNFKGELNLTGPVMSQIAELNPKAELPDTTITPAYRTDGSGTTFVFTSYLVTQSKDFTSEVGGGKQVKWPVGQGGKGNEGVTQVVQSTPGALGYIELNYAIANKIPFAAVQNKDGKFVKASPKSVAAAGEGAVKQMDKSLAVNLWNQSGENTYPISAFTYIIVYKDLNSVKDADKAKALIEFLKWSTTGQGQKLALDKDYAPLSEGVQSKVKDAINTLTWQGKPIASTK